jgi:hypothetical protein
MVLDSERTAVDLAAAAGGSRGRVEWCLLARHLVVAGPQRDTAREAAARGTCTDTAAHRGIGRWRHC